jgi:hypothetical protein
MRMRKLILAATLLGGSMLPLAPPAEAQRTVVVHHRPVHVRRGRFFHRGRWYNHRRMRRGRWVYW